MRWEGGAALVLVAALATGVWLQRSGDVNSEARAREAAAPREGASEPSAPSQVDAIRAGLPEVEAPERPAPPGGKELASAGAAVVIERADLPGDGPYELLLDLPPDLVAEGGSEVVVVSLDGRRLETRMRTRPGEDSGTSVEIDTSFLSPGRYLVHVDVEEAHPLAFRRYVIEVR